MKKTCFSQGHLTALTEFHGQFLISTRTPHGRSRTFKNIIWLFHVHLTNFHGIFWKIIDFSMDNSRTLIDFSGQFFISPRTPHGRSRTYTDNISLPHGHHTDVLRFSWEFLISQWIPHERSKIFPDNFWLPLRQLTDAHGLSRTIFDFPTDSWRALMDVYGLSLTVPQTYTDFHGHLMDAYEFSRTIFDFPMDTVRTLTDIHGPFFISQRAPDARSRTFTENFWFLLWHLTDAHKLSRINLVSS